MSGTRYRPTVADRRYELEVDSYHSFGGRMTE